MEAILLEKSSPQKMLIRFSAVRWSRAHRSLETHKAGLSTANYRASNTNTKKQIHRCKYTNANTQMQIHKCKYTNTKYKYAEVKSSEIFRDP